MIVRCDMVKKLLMVCLAVALVPAAAVTEKASGTRIKEVTVYPDRALVTRQAKLTFAPGVRTVTVADLPGGLRDDSVRAWGKGNAKVRLVGLNVTREELYRADEEQIRRLEDELERIRSQIRQLEDERAVLDEETQYLESLAENFAAVYNRGILTGSSRPEALAGAENMMARRLNSIAGRRVEADSEIRRLKRKAEAVEEELNKLRHPGLSEKKKLEVELQCLSGGDFNLEFSYVIPGAGWTPVYDVRAEPGKERIELVSRARVGQRTGERWEDVKLVLSTASPHVGGEMPEPVPMVLDVAEGEGEGGWAGMLGMAKKAQAPRMSLAQALVNKIETAAEYIIEKPRTISADGKPYYIPIAADTFEGEFNYVALPRESPHAYLQAKVENTTDKFFSGGSASIFLAGRFVARASIPEWAPGEEIEMPLGIDENISVERKLLNKKTETFFGKTTVSYKWRIEVANNLEKTAVLKLYEPVPQSRHEDIEVKVTLTEPEPSEMEREGKARWDMKLEKGEKQEVTLAYQIKYPSGKKVVNLP